jgi:hypothetical protein
MLGLTIDSINLFKSWKYLNDFDFQNFEKTINAKPIDRGKYKGWKEGFYKNFKVLFNPNYGIYFMGSISNYFSGYDSIMLVNQLKNAIENLGKELELNLHSARLYRVDPALNIETDNHISKYTHLLFSDLPRFKRLEQVDGVRFETKKIKIAIYNKSAEVFEKREKDIGINILRIEFRILKGISKVLDIKEMKIQDLYEPKNFEKLIRKFEEYYLKIKKQTVLVDLENANEITPKLLSKVLLKNSILNKFGSEKEAYRQINQWDIDGKIKNANTKSRLRKMISNYSNDKELSKLHPLIDEINRKFLFEIEKVISELYSFDF